MSLSASTVWEVRTTGVSTNAGGFNVGNANFPTDLAATSGNTSAPVVTSASYTFVAGDVGATLFVKSGTNWTPGFYPIASVSAGAATLSAAIGAANLYGGATNLNTAAGCATTASPTGATWGMDYSQQDSPRYSFTDLVIDGTTNTKFTSAAFPVGVNFVGNLVKVASGTGFTVQTVEVVSVSGTTATCDKSLGTLSSTGGVGKLGGALDHPKTLVGAFTRDNKAFVKAGTYTFTAGITLDQQNVGTSNPGSRMDGYYQTRGDITATANLANRPLFQVSGSFSTMLTGPFYLSNVILDGNSTASPGGGSVNYICVFKNSNGRLPAASFLSCEITTIGSDYTSTPSSGNVIQDCYIHGNTSSNGLYLDTGALFTRNLLVSNAVGLFLNGSAYVLNNVIASNTGDGLKLAGAGVGSAFIQGNIIAFNGGYGLNASAAGYPSRFGLDGNAYYSNTSGNRHFVDDTTSNPQDGVSPYTNALDVTLTADPFVLKASADYRLNSTAGGGAACRGHGVPTTWPGNSLTTSAPDIGAAQHADPAVADASVINRITNITIDRSNGGW